MASKLVFTKYLASKQRARRTPANGIEAELIGVDELRMRLKDPEFIKGPLRDFLFHASSIGKREALDSIDGGTGIAVRSIGAKVYTLDATVYTAIARKRALSIERGRPPGELIPWQAALRFVTGRQRSFTPTADEKRKAETVIAAVLAHGAKGKFFLKRARAKVKSEMPRLVADIAAKIRRKWGGMAA